MAKGNMLQGMARGKVGDVVFSRLNGEQISRVRNRHPKNPRSNAQLYQRAIMATVMQAYSAGKIIFDHAFEGRAIGAGNQRRFMALNAKLLRSQIAADINNNVAVASQVGRVVAPGSQTPVPAQLIISEGTYDQAAFNYTPDSSTGTANWKLPAKTSGEKLSEYAARVGLIPGDIYTLVGFITKDGTATYNTPGVTSPYGIVRNCEFAWVRCTVKEDVLTSDATAFDFGAAFDVESSPNVQAFSLSSIDQILNINQLLPIGVTGNTGIHGVIGLIRSRKDNDLRSTSQLVISGHGSVTETDDMKYGITSEYVLDAWTAGTSQLGDSDLILEGGDFNGRAGEETGD